MKVYYDLHIHSALSPCADNDMTPCNIVNMAYLKGLDIIAVTDHNSTKNAEAVIKAGEKIGLTVIAGMEIETAEEVHVLSLFPSIDMAKKAECVVQEHLPAVSNKEEIFGQQLILDENDNIISEEKQLLITATSLSIEEVFSIVRSFGGVAIASHVDRSSNSVLSNLGFIPEDVGISTIEISQKTENVLQYLEDKPALNRYKVIRNSDAHRLGDISERINSIEVTNNNVQQILSKLA